jgi:glutamyl-tRNA reductase
MNQEIYLIGLNHKSAEVDVREQYALPECNPRERGLVSPEGPITEALILSTCNRVEILVVGRPDCDIPDLVSRFWAEQCTGDLCCLTEHVYTYTGLEAVQHLFAVASSLDSLVLGEPQILGQLKSAYRRALETKSSRTIINRIIHKAFSVAKRVRTETAIASSAVSISYAAVELAKKIFGELDRQRAMLIGAGEMAELAATHLLGAGVKSITVANRTLKKGEELAGQFNGTAVPFDRLHDALAEADIIISSTGARSAVIRARDMKAVLKKRKHRPMFFIDIAVPRDIDPDVNSLDNIYLYDIDDLKEVVEENMSSRQQEAEKAWNIIAEELDAFARWLKCLELQPTIVDLYGQGESIARRELKKSLKSLGPDADPKAVQALETLALSLCKKLYHEPVTFLKRRAEEEEAAREFIHVTRRMFNLDRECVPADAHRDRKK